MMRFICWISFSKKCGPSQPNLNEHNKISFLISVEQIFREANINIHGTVKYEQFVKIVCAPVPDYYWAKISFFTKICNKNNERI